MRSGEEVGLLTLLAYDRSFIMTEVVCVRMCVSSFSWHSFKHIFPGRNQQLIFCVYFSFEVKNYFFFDYWLIFIVCEKTKGEGNCDGLKLFLSKDKIHFYKFPNVVTSEGVILRSN